MAYAKSSVEFSRISDGYIAGPNGEYDWCFSDDDYGMTDFLKSVDATLMGGKSYRLVISDGEPYPEFHQLCFYPHRKEKSLRKCGIGFRRHT